MVCTKNTFGLLLGSTIIYSLHIAGFSSGSQNFLPCDTKYHNCELLNEGHDGRVYRCFEIENPSSQVALKYYHRHDTFENEVKLTDLMKTSSHPEYFLSLLDKCVSDSRTSVAVFELFTYDLHTFTTKENTPFDIRSISLQILTAIATLHEMGYVHRDVKPANIGLKGGDLKTVKLFDLAFAETIREPDVYRIRGTPEYLAPEIVMSEFLYATHAVKQDVWSVGVSLLAIGSRDRFVTEQMMYERVNLDKMLTPCYVMFIYIYVNSVFGPAEVTERETAKIQKICPTFTDQKIMTLLKSDGVETSNSHFNSFLNKVRLDVKLNGLNPAESEQFVDLIRGLLTFDYHMRPTAAQAMRHDFFYQSSTDTSSTSVFDSGVEDHSLVTDFHTSGTEQTAASASSSSAVASRKSFKEDKHTTASHDPLHGVPSSNSQAHGDVL